ncbi:hypothetical protein [Pantoea agglomerans]|uniref:hypothetical protein n=1 Tax=Enterobacter agglomerans TaxID=549 RepID=UPI002896E7DD|nr:hypothetical protein [Pantoea agglomerans]WNK42639.1 hypothetical protein RM160_23320 [Pantoea agglomerans]
MNEIYLNATDIEDIQSVQHANDIDVVVFIPLDSVGFSSSYIDLCDDYLEAIWTAEKLAGACQHAEVVYANDNNKHKKFFKLTLTNPNDEFYEVLRDCIILYKRFDDTISSDPPEDYSRLRDEVLSLENNLDNLNVKLPILLDDYYANLIGGKYYEMRADAPDDYRNEIIKYPERALGFWVSAYSSIFGVRCYASSDSWLLPKSIDLNNFFEITGQNYTFDKFTLSNILVLNGVSYSTSDLIISYFPMQQYFKSRICSSIELSRDEDLWPPDPFDWSNATFTYSPYLNNIRDKIGHDSSLLAPAPTSGNYYIDLNGTLALVDDGEFYHLLYDTSELNSSQMKDLNAKLADAVLSTGVNIGFSDKLKHDWSTIDDEQFERLCYDIIYSHPRFNSETIRKLGNSRSRDGGRDIQVYDIPIDRLVAPKKWIFQCKLVKGKGSLSASKLIDVSDMLDLYDVEGFGVLTNTTIDATLYDKIDKVCSKRGIDQLNFSALEIEKELIRKPYIRMKYFK